jgi:hypothetical protein
MTYPTPPLFMPADDKQKELESEFSKYITKQDSDEIAKKNQIF